MSLFKRREPDTRARGSGAESQTDPSGPDVLRLIDEGNAIEDSGRLEEALRLYETAISMAPRLARAHLNRGNVLLAMGNIEGALETFAAAISLDRAYAPAHYNLGIAYARAERHGEARSAFEAALALQPDFADAEVALGCSLEELGERDSAVACYRRALNISPRHAEVHCNLGNALRSLEQIEAAVASYRRAVEIKPDFAAAHYSLGRSLQDLGKTDDAVASYRRALESDPRLVAAHSGLGSALLGLGRFDEAVASYRHVLEIDPHSADAHWNLGNAWAKLGRTDDAATSYRQALRLQPDMAVAMVNLGNALLDLGQMDEALASYRRAVDAAPSFAAAWTNLGNALKKNGQIEAARESLTKALQLDPDSPMIHSNLGIVQKELGLQEDALASYRRALEIKPDFAEAHCNLGDLLRDLGQYDDAEESCRVALRIDPNCLPAYNNLGNVLTSLGRFDEAAACYRRALQLEPDFLELHYNLGNVLRNLGSPAAAVASFRRALEIKPDYAAAHVNLAAGLQDLGHMDAAADSCRRALQLDPDVAHACTNLLFCLSHREVIDTGALFAEHCRYGERFEAPLRATWPLHSNARDPERCLRIGFVSPDLRDHVVALFLEPILKHLAGATAFSVHAYYNHTREDHVSARLRRYVRHWHSIVLLSDAALAQKIADDGIDILIDLSGHTGLNRLLVFARKPAPVQVSWIGYPGTTGLKAMDYYLADEHLLPRGEFAGQFTEKLAYLPVNAAYLPDELAPDVNALPALRNGFMTFGSFNRISKLSRSAVALWTPLLRALPAARLVLAGMPPAPEYEWLIDWFVQEGIARERIIAYPRCASAAYLGLHQQVDMCLDTFPYTGGTTTYNALWMGVPTLTLTGHTAPGRQGTAILSRVGLDGFAARDAADFERKGLFWAGQPGALADLRASLRERVENSPVRHPEVIAAALENALRTMWRRWCAGLPPETFTAVAQPAKGVSPDVGAEVDLHRLPG